ASFDTRLLSGDISPRVDFCKAAGRLPFFCNDGRSIIMSPRPNSLAARDAAFHLHGYTNAKKNEQEGGFVITRGKGIYVYDEDGKEYLDGMAALWCSGLGFGEEPRLTQAAVKQMQELPFYHTFTQKVASVTVELAEKLVNLAPVPMSK